MASQARCRPTLKFNRSSTATVRALKLRREISILEVFVVFAGRTRCSVQAPQSGVMRGLAAWYRGVS